MCCGQTNYFPESATNAAEEWFKIKFTSIYSYLAWICGFEARKSVLDVLHFSFLTSQIRYIIPAIKKIFNELVWKLSLTFYLV